MQGAIRWESLARGSQDSHDVVFQDFARDVQTTLQELREELSWWRIRGYTILATPS